MAASSPSSSRGLKYDVFLSFRGEDTRRGFTDHLYKRLQRGGIYTFRDDNEIQDGTTISPELMTAIETSRIAIVVLSKNYASSTWCLEELVKIFECKEELGMDVVPIFYDVEPSDIRKQKGCFGEAFGEHEARFGVDDLKVQKWRQVLSKVASIKGRSSKDWQYESDFMEEIFEAISKKIQPTLIVTREDKLVGIDSKLKLLTMLLNKKSSNVVLVGIWGMGGIGKTTIARVVYEKFLHKFEVGCFLPKIREKCEARDLPYLQRKFLSRIANKSFHILDEDEGFAMIEKVLRDKKVLLVLDDVDQSEQIDKLVPKDELGSGSRIIITTRNEDLLKTSGAERYKMGLLEDDEALQLLSLKAFNEKYPKEGYLNLSESIVNVAGGHPLALEVLGSSLRNKDVVAWSNTVEALQSEGVDHEDKIFKVLKISYEGIGDEEKEIFLDIACFFKGKKRDLVVEILDGCDFNATRKVEILVQKSLITITNRTKRLQMHDLLQQMGRKIVRQKFQNRLWCHKDIKKMSQVENKIESIFYKSTTNAQISISFSRMHQLRLLNVHDVQLRNHSESFPAELRYLKWKEYPLKFLPFSSEENELIELHMCHSNLEELWKGEKHLEKLKYIKLSHSQKLFKIPDLTKVPNLKELNLEGCTKLVSIHSSIFVVGRLIFLNLKDCINLTSLPSCIEIQVLEVFILSGCSKIKKIPEIEGNTDRLLELYLDDTSISELPSSIGNLSGLNKLSLKNCHKLVSLPSTIGMLKSLQSLDVSGCSSLGNQLENVDDTECLEELDVRGTAKREESLLFLLETKIRDGVVRGVRWLMPQFYQVPSRGVFEIPSLSSLTILNLSYCNLGAVPDGIASLSTLMSLYLAGNNFSHLPTSILQLTNLGKLKLDGCKKLLSFPELPPSISCVQSNNCVSLTGNIPDVSKFGHSHSRKNLELISYRGFDNNEESYQLFMRCIEKEIFRGERLNITLPGSKVPEWFTETKMGDSIRIEYGDANSKSFSYVICAVFGPTGQYDIAEFPFTLTADMYLESGSNNQQFFCGVTGDSGLKSDHIWILSDSHKLFDSCKSIKFVFEITLDDEDDVPSSIEVKKCGVCLIKGKMIH